MFVLVRFAQARAVLLMLGVLFPVLLRAVRRPAAVGTFKLDSLRLRLGVRVDVRVSRGANGARRERLYGLATGDDSGERRLGERVEQIILGQYRDWLCGIFRAAEKAKDTPGVGGDGADAQGMSAAQAREEARSRRDHCGSQKIIFVQIEPTCCLALLPLPDHSFC